MECHDWNVKKKYNFYLRTLVCWFKRFSTFSWISSRLLNFLLCFDVLFSWLTRSSLSGDFSAALLLNKSHASGISSAGEDPIVTLAAVSGCTEISMLKQSSAVKNREKSTYTMKQVQYTTMTQVLLLHKQLLYLTSFWQKQLLQR